MALSPDRQTLLTVVAGTVIGMPALTAAWRAVIWPGPGQDDLAHEHVVDLVRLDAGPLEGAGDGESAELRGREPAEGPESLPIGVRAPATMTVPGMTTSVACGQIRRRPLRAGHNDGDHDTASRRQDDPWAPRRPARCAAGPGPVLRPAAGQMRRLSCPSMQEFLAAIDAGASGDELAAIALPDHYRAAFVRRDEVDMFDGLDSATRTRGSPSTWATWPYPSWPLTRPTSP